MVLEACVLFVACIVLASLLVCTDALASAIVDRIERQLLERGLAMKAFAQAVVHVLVIDVPLATLVLVSGLVPRWTVLLLLPIFLGRHIMASGQIEPDLRKVAVGRLIYIVPEAGAYVLPLVGVIGRAILSSGR